eukprot:CAMPEP_0168419146 /NCGR_PEP_ID=MMETSP0228-20121227/32120_1 /TAXON_ID=133427 /ORGANISM="Protoceratium reticulatum, Strain CCCM 535 (=CCMP 1889)" /LENGTH=356 /DNA_ID=CAMNT_0008433023 /DNA_START=43 /DNA_END=1113 /DNA_ORIENTATION=+
MLKRPLALRLMSDAINSVSGQPELVEKVLDIFRCYRPVRHSEHEVKDREAVDRTLEPTPTESVGDAPGTVAAAEHPRRRGGLRPVKHHEMLTEHGEGCGSSSSRAAPELLAPASTRELHRRVAEVKATLEERGEAAPEEQALRISDQLAGVFIDGGIGREAVLDAERGPHEAPRSPLDPLAVRARFMSSCRSAGSTSASSAGAQTPTSTRGSTFSSTARRSEGHRRPGTVKFHVTADMLKGSDRTFRDAQVDFQERQVVVRAVDCSGRSWTLRSSSFPGPIAPHESSFQIAKSGKDLSITLKKANVDDLWLQDSIRLSEEEPERTPGQRPPEEASCQLPSGSRLPQDYKKVGHDFF